MVGIVFSLICVSFLLLPALLCDGYVLQTRVSLKASLSQRGQCNRMLTHLSMCLVNDQKNQNTGVKKSILGSKIKLKAPAPTQKNAVVKAVKSSEKKTTPPPATAAKVFKKEPKKVQPDITGSSSSSISVSSSSKSVSSVQTDGELSENSNLDSLTIDEGFRTALKDFRKSNAPKKLLRAVADYSESGRLDQNMTVHAFRTLQRMNR